MKEGGQALLGGLDCGVQRNFFGAQINSFEARLAAPACLPRGSDASDTFRAVFIRAPAIVETGPGARAAAPGACAAGVLLGRQGGALGRASASAAAALACSTLGGRAPFAPMTLGCLSLRPLCPLCCAGVEVLAEYQLTPEEAAAAGRGAVVVAVRSGHLMATAFHPELTQVGGVKC